MGRGTVRAGAAIATVLLAIAGCGSSAFPTVVANPLPTASTVATPSNGASQTIIAIESPSGAALASPSAATAHHWTGTDHSVALFAPGCSMTADATLSALVSTGGQVSGTATGSYVYLRTTCGKTTITGQVTVPITGTRSDTQFLLTIYLQLGMGLPMTVPLTSPTSAHVTATDSTVGQRTYAIDLTCTDC